MPCLLSPQRASAQHLEWLKTVKESHGSVELTSLSLAATINSRGVYILEAPADGRKVRLLLSAAVSDCCFLINVTCRQHCWRVGDSQKCAVTLLLLYVVSFGGLVALKCSSCCLSSGTSLYISTDLLSVRFLWTTSCTSPFWRALMITNCHGNTLWQSFVNCRTN